jgi:hypothetical protein
MIKSIKPGLLAGLSEAQIERKLESLFECDVEYADGIAKIYCIDQYDSEDEKAYTAMFRHLKKLRRVGDARVVCNKNGPFVELTFNPIAMDVISGERARREAKRIKEHEGEKS